MADTGYNSPASCVSIDRDGKQAWNNPDNVKLQNDTYAETSSQEKEDYSDWLRATNFTMGVPEGATINGIVVEIDRKTSPNGVCCDSSLRIRKTAGQVGDDNASAVDWETSDTDNYFVYGGATNLWGVAWTAAEINSVDFGVDLSCLGTSGDFIPEPDVDHIRIKVFYTEDGAPAAGQNESQINRLINPNINGRLN